MPGPRGPRGPKPKLDNPGKLFGRIIKEIFSGYTPHIIVVVICIFVSVLANVQGTMFIKSLIDDYIAPMCQQVENGQEADFVPLIHAIIRIAFFYGIGVLAALVQAKIMIYVTQGTLRGMRNKMFVHMESLPISYFDSHSHGDIMSLYTNDIDTLRQMISQSLPQFLNSAITIISVFVSMVMLSVPLTIVTIIMVIIMLSATKASAGLSSKHFVGQQHDLGKVNGFIEEMMEGQKVVKVFCHENKNIAEFNAINDTLCESAYNANKYANIVGPINAQLGNVSFVICALVGGIIAIFDFNAHIPAAWQGTLIADILSRSNFLGLSLGGIASFLNFNKSFSMPINQISTQLNSIIMALAGADRIFKLLDETPEVDEGYVTLVNVEEKNGKLVETKERTHKWAWRHEHQADKKVDYVPLTGDVVFDDVDFGYVPEKIVLHNVDLFATPGQKIAFVGSTGAGKTTITNLINRFYDIQDGKIRYDGININKIKKDDLRHSLGIVLQDTHLFTGTVADNIRYGKLDATDEEVIAAAKLANADGFIRRLPQGYDTVLTGDGASLSQGQRQLLAIDRDSSWQ